MATGRLQGEGTSGRVGGFQVSRSVASMCTNIDTAHLRPFLGRAWKALTSRWHDDSAWLEAKKGSPVHSAPGSPDYVRRPNKIASKKTGHDDDVPALVSFAHVIAHVVGVVCTCHCKPTHARAL